LVNNPCPLAKGFPVYMLGRITRQIFLQTVKIISSHLANALLGLAEGVSGKGSSCGDGFG